MKRRNKQKEKKIAEERIDILFSEAAENPSYADRYVAMARKLAMKINLSLPRKYQRQFCKHCYKYLRFGVNATRRTKNGKLITYCKSCKKYSRIALAKNS
tara:strand:+ start:6483 stop:6782 length:300 start_codon:yes stop_codon:yes gene_type:complete